MAHHTAVHKSFAYLDSSVLLRVVLGEPGALPALSQYGSLYSSRLLKTESLRTIQRLRLTQTISEEINQIAIQRLRFLLMGVNLIAPSEEIFGAAEGEFPFVLKTLDAIHLASALMLRNHLKQPQILILTHDLNLARNSRAVGFDVEGV